MPRSKKHYQIKYLITSDSASFSVELSDNENKMLNISTTLNKKNMNLLVVFIKNKVR